MLFRVRAALRNKRQPLPKFHGTGGTRWTERNTNYSVFAAMLLLVIGGTPWRQGRFYTGQLDWVVLAKTGLLIAALLVVLWARGNVARSGRSINTVPAPALLLLALFVGSSALGALLYGDLLSSLALSARQLVVGFVVLVLIELVEPMTAISTLSRVLAVVSIFIAVTGTFHYPPPFTGRLTGNFPPVTPNEIAFLAAVPMIYLVWRTVNVDTSFVRILALIALGAIIYLTVSRATAAIAALISLALIIRGSRKWRLRRSITAGAVICVLFTLTFTHAIQHFARRAGTMSNSTLNSRTIGWNAVLNSHRSPMQLLFGEGLAKNTVPIVGHFWKWQTINSTWVTAFVQAGLIGSVLAVVMVTYAATQALRNARPVNDLWLALLAFIAVRSIFENGLLDTSASFLVFMVVSLGAATHAHLRGLSEGEGNHLHTGSGAITLPRTTFRDQSQSPLRSTFGLLSNDSGANTCRPHRRVRRPTFNRARELVMTLQDAVHVLRRR
jgi:O-antigen ligase